MQVNLPETKGQQFFLFSFEPKREQNYLISILVTDCIQKRRGEPGLFSFEYNLLPNQIFTTTWHMDLVLGQKSKKKSFIFWFQ